MPTAQNNKTAKPAMSKSEFIRSQPGRMRAKEVVALAKKQGLDMDDKYVYVVRSNARRKGKKKRRGRPPGSRTRRMIPSTEKQFRRLAVELGVKRAEEILSDTKKRLKALIAGD